MTRIVIAGAGAVGASIAYHLGLSGASGVLLVDRGPIAGGQTAKAFGGVRQQFSTSAEVVLAKESLAFFEELGAAFFHQVGYLFLATTEAGTRRADRATSGSGAARRRSRGGRARPHCRARPRPRPRRRAGRCPRPAGRPCRPRRGHPRGRRARGVARGRGARGNGCARRRGRDPRDRMRA